MLNSKKEKKKKEKKKKNHDISICPISLNRLLLYIDQIKDKELCLQKNSSGRLNSVQPYGLKDKIHGIGRISQAKIHIGTGMLFNVHKCKKEHICR